MKKMEVVLYSCFEIWAHPDQLVDSDEWSVNIDISRHSEGPKVWRHFSSKNTFKTCEKAIHYCFDFGRQIIDSKIDGCSVSDL